MKWSITQFTGGAILYKDLGAVPDDVYEQTITLDGDFVYRNLCGLDDF